MRISLKSFFSRLMLSQLLVILITLLVIGVIFGYLIQRYYFGIKEWEVITKGQRIAALITESIPDGRFKEGELDKFSDTVHALSQSAEMDLWILDEEGTITLRSESIETSFQLALEEEEIEHVLSGNSITKKIMGPVYQNLLMVVPLMVDEKREGLLELGTQKTGDREIIGAIVMRSSLGTIAATANYIIRLALYSGLVAIVAAGFLSLSLSRSISKPLESIKQAARDFASGRYRPVKVPKKSSEEIIHLGKTFNYAVEQIHLSMQKQKKLEEIQREFIANVSHEFRAPLTSIRGFLEILYEEERDADKKKYLEIMLADSSYLERLVHDLLRLGRLESHASLANEEMTSPSTLVERAIDSIQQIFQEKDLSIEVDLEEDLPKVQVDRDHIHQVLINFLDNAIKFSPLGSTILIKVREEEGKVYFSVEDEGPGIREENLSSIWDRFYKVDQARTRSQHGSGLGLAIAKNIVEKHGGRVGVESERGVGSTFWFYLEGCK